MKEEQPIDCRIRGIGHDYRRWNETETDIIYVCTTCGRQMFMDKKTNMIQPERTHGNTKSDSN